MRKSRKFWCVLGQGHRVSLVDGYEYTNNPNMWWCPEVGFTLTCGRHLFDTEEEAEEVVQREAAQRAVEIATRELFIAEKNLVEARKYQKETKTRRKR